MKNDRANEVKVGDEVFGKGLNNVVKDIDMDYPPEWRLSRSNRRKP
jgi:enoyl-CoA hydratase